MPPPPFLPPPFLPYTYSWRISAPISRVSPLCRSRSGGGGGFASDDGGDVMSGEGLMVMGKGLNKMSEAAASLAVGKTGIVLAGGGDSNAAVQRCDSNAVSELSECGEGGLGGDAGGGGSKVGSPRGGT